jgi:hypothetical protein
LQLRKHGLNLSPEKIREAINSLEVCTLVLDEDKYLAKSKPLPLANQILKTLRMKQIKNVIPYEESQVG